VANRIFQRNPENLSERAPLSQGGIYARSDNYSFFLTATIPCFTVVVRSAANFKTYNNVLSCEGLSWSLSSRPKSQ
jgi:hypothetical protein